MPRPSLTLYQQEKPALGCPITLTISSSASQNDIDSLFAQLWIYILEFEKRCSRFLAHSELSSFNANAGIKTSISSDFKNILKAAKKMAALTNDLYNPFVLPALQRAGYVKSQFMAHAKDPQIDYSQRSIVSPSKLKIYQDAAQIPYGTALDLGGCGKGYIGDVLADYIQKQPIVNGFWFSLGGDVICGGHNQNYQPWQVHVQADTSQGKVCIGHINQPGIEHIFAIATSAITVRTGTAHGRKWHHIIDPKTGLPAKSDVQLATIASDSLLLADVLASCIVIVGSSEGPKLASACGATHYLIQPKNSDNLISSEGFYDTMTTPLTA